MPLFKKRTRFQDQPVSSENPCIRCGACCITYRVPVHHRELETSPGGWVPIHLVDNLNSNFKCMSGTRHKPLRCVALQGTVGQEVRCSIYADRPSTCRGFHYHGQEGIANYQCFLTRYRHGLKRLPFYRHALARAGKISAVIIGVFILAPLVIAWLVHIIRST